MNEKQDPLADIVAEMRDKAAEAEGKLVAGAAAWFRAFADRIEAVAKREHFRDDAKKGGNAAAMRLCDELIRAAYDADICSPSDLAQRVRRIQAALSAPARNCDKYANVEDAETAWFDYKMSCPYPPGGWSDGDLLEWFFAKAEGGDHA